ncbi:hypothetical protein BST81_17385 [Leptolyngbya sp. 'hensonii']|nr:hypothetical protein BST81_17385 [Leptolyngbya sp. 'hensonii']
MHHVTDLAQGLHWHLSWDGTVLAQQQFNQDIMSDMQKAFNHFVKTGQVWALLVGIILGYLFKSLTSFG